MDVVRQMGEIVEPTAQHWAELRAAYVGEAQEVFYILPMLNSPGFLARVANWDSYLRQRTFDIQSIRQAQIADGTYLLNTANLENAPTDIFAITQFVSCCMLFNGLIVPMGKYTQEEFITEALEAVLPKDPLEEGAYHLAYVKLHYANVFRTMQILKLLGIIDYDVSRTLQLALGAASAVEDFFYLHAQPEIIHLGGENSVAFRFHYATPRHMIAVDNDPVNADTYAELSEKHPGQFKGIIGDSIETISALSGQNKAKELERRNMVTALRIEPSMIPDPKAFLLALASVIDNSADLIITVGGGDDVHEFIARQQRMAEIHSLLQACKLNPVRLMIYEGENPEEQRARPIFGNVTYGTHEVIYCKLQRYKLQKHLR
ncbi:hypothetical protein JW766_03145 [Candidatus Dojkabacteria bacterium]|nr:hypothetical protein [Candidatus Dojkabacteria bacterium]